MGKDNEESYDLEYPDTALDDEQASLSYHQETQSLSDCSGEDDGERRENDKMLKESDAVDEDDEGGPPGAHHLKFHPGDSDYDCGPWSYPMSSP